MKTIIEHNGKRIEIDDKITLTIKEGADGEVILSIESEPENNDFINSFLEPNNAGIDLENYNEVLEAHKESKGGKDT